MKYLLMMIIGVVFMIWPGNAVASPKDEEKAFLEQRRSIFIDNVWSGASIGFTISTRGNRQYVAYYDAERRMTIAHRSLDSEEWKYHRLNNRVGWDSHNSVTFAFDSEGHIHVSGNMHVDPLVYFRTTIPGDVSSLEEVHRMTGVEEDKVTYPRFHTGPNGEFLYSYRHGSSGSGNNMMNIYDTETKTWRRYTQNPLLDGEGKMNAYASGPVRGRQGTYHLAWVWRDTYDCATNHSVSYAQSPGSLDNWQRSDGTPIELPMTIRNTDIIDPVQVKSGLLNNIRLSFDADNRPMVTYMKYDPNANTQIYTMRLEGSSWKRYQTTNWNDRFEFSGGGSIVSMISFGGPSRWDDTGLLYQIFTNRYWAPHSRIRFLEPERLQPVGESIRLYPATFDTPGRGGDWQVNISGFSLDAARRNGSAWALRWEAMKPHRDRPREEEPPPTRLELVELGIAARP